MKPSNYVAFMSSLYAEQSYNRRKFLGLIKLLSTLDSQLHQHVDTSNGTKCTSMMIQNELLDCIYEVYTDSMKSQLRNANFVVIEADETTVSDVSCRSEFVIIIRYVEILLL